MKTLGEVLQLSTAFLEDKKIARPRRQAEEILSHLLHLPRLDLYMQFDRPLVENELESCRAILKRRAKGEPLDYIFGEVSFFNCTIEVSPVVLIPRQETEILLSKIIERLPQENLEVWDVCCGSGCLGIALKKAKPSFKVTLSDISSEALEVARRNAVKNQVDVEILQGDLLAPFQGRRADVVICNPPYVTEEEYLQMDHSEPKIALVSGPTGLEFYERLAKDLPKHCGKVFLEIGTGMGEKVLQLFSSKRKSVEKDWAGHDRFFFLEFE